MTKMLEELIDNITATSYCIYDYENITKENAIITYMCYCYILNDYIDDEIAYTFKDILGTHISENIYSQLKKFENYYQLKHKIDLKLLIEEKINNVDYIGDLYKSYFLLFTYGIHQNVVNVKILNDYYTDLVTRTNRIEKLKELYE